MEPIEKLRKVRLEKLEKIRKLKIDPFPAKALKKQTIGESLKSIGKEVTTAGRIMAIRSHGGSTFMDLADESAKIQLFLSQDKLSIVNRELLTLLDIGDFIQVRGRVGKTQAGETTIFVSDFKLLTKSLRPIPQSFYGLKDIETRLRKRHLDLIVNPEVRELFIKKTKFWQSVRQFLLENAFLEVETPALEQIPGGADARPFQTHHNALDLDVYLRISMGELWQKRLMVAGFEKTFEIGRQFRNEGMDAEHLQDYTQMEFHWAYASYNEGMALTEEMIKRVARDTFGTQQFKIGSYDVDLSKPWERYDYTETIKKLTGVDVASANLTQIEKRLKELKIDYAKQGFNLTRAMDSLWKYCRKQLTGPGFLMHVPVVISPLAKRKSDQPDLTERFQVIIAGSELCNGYSELNDPLDQAKRFAEQQQLREAGDEEAQMNDEDFVEALEYGMPPTCGLGISERLFAFLSNKTLRECQLFPLVKPKNSA